MIFRFPQLEEARKKKPGIPNSQHSCLYMTRAGQNNVIKHRSSLVKKTLAGCVTPVTVLASGWNPGEGAAHLFMAPQSGKFWDIQALGERAPLKRDCSVTIYI